MPHTATTTPSFRVTLLVILVTLLSLFSCTEESPTDCVLYDVGAVEGYVLAAGHGVSVRVGARVLEGVKPRNIISETQSDTTGWYRLEMPVGMYRMETDPLNTRVSSSDMRDTVRVGPRVHRRDLLRGRAEIQILMPEELDGRGFALNLVGQDIANARAHDAVHDGHLRFVFPAVQPGRYVMELDYGGLHGELYLPGTVDVYTADSLTVNTEQIASYATDFTHLYASISGHVTGSWQVAGRGPPSVTAYSNWMQAVASDYCGSDGSFSLDLFYPQRVCLQMGHNDVLQWFEGDSFESARVFDVQPGDRITGISVVAVSLKKKLEGPGDVIVHDPSVLVRDELGNEFEPAYWTDNPVIVCNLRPGRRLFLYVEGHCDGQIWAGQWYDGVATLNEATPIELGEGELRELVLKLVAGGRIAGELLTSAGGHPAAAYCRLYDSAGEPLCPQPQFCEAGVFNLTGLADGEYYLVASMGLTGRSWWYPGTYDIENAVKIPIVDHAAITGLVWSLPAFAGVVKP